MTYRIAHSAIETIAAASAQNSSASRSMRGGRPRCNRLIGGLGGVGSGAAVEGDAAPLARRRRGATDIGVRCVP